MPAKIAIIGGGAAAVAMCLRLYENIREASEVSNNPYVAEICVFEKNNTIGPGVPYSTPYDCHLLNFPKKIMTAVYDSNYLTNGFYGTDSGAENQTNLFNSYLHTNYPPRHLYGEYLESRAEQIQNEAIKFGVTLEFRRNTEVIDVKSLDEENFLIEAKAENYTANYVVLCTGNMPSTNFREFIGKEGFWQKPFYSEEDAKNFDPKKIVVIIGSRTSAIDTALYLFSEKHAQEKVIMVSRSGLLPVLCPQKFVNYQLKYMPEYIEAAGTSISLDALISLFWKEISDAEGYNIDYSSIVKSYEDITALHWLDRQIKEAEMETPNPSSYIIAEVFLLFPKIWQALNKSDQEAFLKSYYGLFMTYASHIPLQFARKLRELIQDDRLSVRGGVESITTDTAGTFIVRFEDGTSLSTSQLINATGCGYDIDSVPLYKSMRQRGLIAAHRLGGIDVNPQTFCVVNKDGIESASIVLGDTS
uniref:FAD-dependent urate hydroxylase HpyO/Asp monooxygenase CreE-like FAD/NAD(P)-binding domain-containing protein n=1 Tax=Plectus sambesii TaxID=2011161 RepID=A0A914WRM6_9BILA